jgi:hypothetical protein
VLEFKKASDCEIVTVGSWYAMTGYGIGFPKDSKWIRPINNCIMELQVNGTVAYRIDTVFVYQSFVDGAVKA